MILWHAETTCDRCKRNRAPCYVALIAGNMQVQPPPGWKTSKDGTEMHCPGCQISTRPLVVAPGDQ